MVPANKWRKDLYEAALRLQNSTMTQQEKKERLSLVLKTTMHWKRSSRSPSIPLQVAYPIVVSAAILISCWIMWSTSAANTNCTISNLWVHFYTLVLPMVWRHTIVYTPSKLLNWNCSSNPDLQTDSKKQQWENLETSVEECICTRESCQQFTTQHEDELWTLSCNCIMAEPRVSWDFKDTVVISLLMGSLNFFCWTAAHHVVAESHVPF